MGFGVDEENNLVVSAILAFFSTTIDDFVVLLFFIALAEKKDDFARAHAEILVGLTAAYVLILGISLLALVLTFIASEEWVCLIGFVPIVLGIMKAWELAERDCKEKKNAGHEKLGGDNPGEESSLLEHGGTVATVENDGDNNTQRTPVSRGQVSLDEHSVSIASERASLASDKDLSGFMAEIPTPEDINDSFLNKVLGPCFKHLMTPLALEVFLTTVACGSDNIAIYASVFAAESLIQVGFTIAIIFGLIYLMYLLACVVVKLEAVRYFCITYTEYIIPPLLIVLGIYVLTDSILWTAISS